VTRLGFRRAIIVPELVDGIETASGGVISTPAGCQLKQFPAQLDYWDHNTGSGLIPRRLQAERDGYLIKTFTTLDGLPDHARTKFELMERAANAES
jgi:hypothetical protein